MFDLKRLTLVALALSSLAACATDVGTTTTVDSRIPARSTTTMPGNLAGLGSDAGSMVLVHKDPFYGPMTMKDYGLAMYLADNCLTDVHHQLSSVWETVVINGSMDAGAGAMSLPLGTGAEAAKLGGHLVKGAVPGLALLGAATSGTQGAVNGFKIKAGAVTNIVGNCGNGDFHDQRVAVQAPGMHMYGSPVRTNNSIHHVPSWAVQADDIAAAAPAQPLKVGSNSSGTSSSADSSTSGSADSSASSESSGQQPDPQSSSDGS